MKWIFLNTGFQTGTYNMEVDVLLTRQFAEQGIPIFRVYGWKPFTISVGYHQSLDVFDLAKVRQAGVNIVRRPTGGGAIFHAEELTYSVVMNIGKCSLREIYFFVNKGLVEGVRQLGIPAELSGQNNNLRTATIPLSVTPCFSSFAKYEIQVNGKKIVGSAQRRYGDIVLQQGTFLLGPQHQRITSFILAADEERDKMHEYLLSHAVDAATWLGRSVSFAEASAAIKSGFEIAHGIKFTEESINQSITYS